MLTDELTPDAIELLLILEKHRHVHADEFSRIFGRHNNYNLFFELFSHDYIQTSACLQEYTVEGVIVGYKDISITDKGIVAANIYRSNRRRFKADWMGRAVDAILALLEKLP